MNVAEMLQKTFQDSATNLQAVQKEYSKTLADRQTLDSQLNENKQVKEELDLSPDGAKVFKLIGPALVNQDLGEARGNVEKRISYIAGELKRKDEQLAALDKKQDESREKMQEVQNQMQKLQQAPA
jgi:prefoldin beta subunit